MGVPRRPLRMVFAVAVAVCAAGRPHIVSAQSSVLAGQVNDETRAPVAGATVIAACGDRTSLATSGTDGAFQLNISDLNGTCHLVV